MILVLEESEQVCAVQNYFNKLKINCKLGRGGGVEEDKCPTCLAIVGFYQTDLQDVFLMQGNISQDNCCWRQILSLSMEKISLICDDRN